MSDRTARTTRERQWLFGGAAATAVLLLVSWLFLVGPQRQHTRAVRQDVAHAQDANVQLRDRLTVLQRQMADLSTYRARRDAARRALPATAGVSDLLRSLQALGRDTGTDVIQLSVGPPTALGGGSRTFSLTLTAQANGSAADLDRFLQRLQQSQPRAVLITAVTEGDSPELRRGSTLQLTMTTFVAPDAA